MKTRKHVHVYDTYDELVEEEYCKCGDKRIKPIEQPHHTPDALEVMRDEEKRKELTEKLIEQLKKAQKLIHESTLCDVGCCDECTDALVAIARAEGK